jgi:hypothetical protein
MIFHCDLCQDQFERKKGDVSYINVSGLTLVLAGPWKQQGHCEHCGRWVSGLPEKSAVCSECVAYSVAVGKKARQLLTYYDAARMWVSGGIDRLDADLRAYHSGKGLSVILKRGIARRIITSEMLIV